MMKSRCQDWWLGAFFEGGIGAYYSKFLMAMGESGYSIGCRPCYILSGHEGKERVHCIKAHVPFEEAGRADSALPQDRCCVNATVLTSLLKDEPAFMVWQCEHQVEFQVMA